MPSYQATHGSTTAAPWPMPTASLNESITILPTAGDAIPVTGSVVNVAVTATVVQGDDDFCDVAASLTSARD